MDLPDLLVSIKQEGVVFYLATYMDPIEAMKEVLLVDCSIELLMLDPRWSIGTQKFQAKDSRTLIIDLDNETAGTKNFGNDSIDRCPILKFYVQFVRNYGSLKRAAH